MRPSTSPLSQLPGMLTVKCSPPHADAGADEQFVEFRRQVLVHELPIAAGVLAADKVGAEPVDQLFGDGGGVLVAVEGEVFVAEVFDRYCPSPVRP